MNPALANGRPCQGCGKWIFFRRDSNGKLGAFDATGNAHKCIEYEELQRLSSEANLIAMVKTMIAITNTRLYKHRLELIVKEGTGS